MALRALAAVALAVAPAAGGPASQSVLPAASPAATASPREEAIRRAIEGAMTRHGIPGLSAAVVTGGELTYSAGFGMADLERFTPATPQTIYRLASISKPMTAVAVLQLHEEGKLDLDAPIERAASASGRARSS
jgi:CubicO group peptidase (beta-lactamase class C family)